MDVETSKEQGVCVETCSILLLLQLPPVDRASGSLAVLCEPSPASFLAMLVSSFNLAFHPPNKNRQEAAVVGGVLKSQAAASPASHLSKSGWGFSVPAGSGAGARAIGPGGAKVLG
jgi:hypothetical protein